MQQNARAKCTVADGLILQVSLPARALNYWVQSTSAYWIC